MGTIAIKLTNTQNTFTSFQTNRQMYVKIKKYINEFEISSRYLLAQGQ